MPNVISRLLGGLDSWSFKYNCYEAVHPWTPFCSDCALDIGTTVFAEAIKLYTPLYLLTQFSQRKLDFESFKRTGQSILRSTTFISANAFFALFFFCSTKHFTGKFYYYAVAYLPAFLASSMAVLIEKPNRRSSLAFYVANVASEALFRVGVARGFLREVPRGQVYLFSVAIASIMYLAKKEGFEQDALSSIIKLVIGPEEARLRVRKNNKTSEMSQSSHQIAIVDGCPVDKHPCDMNHNCMLSRTEHQGSDDQLGKIYPSPDISRLHLLRHPLCPHPKEACLMYALKASARALAIGYIAQLTLRTISRLPAIVAEPRLALDILRDPKPLQLGAFLATFTGLFKAFSCLARWHTNEWTPRNNFLAALAAGPALLLYPSPTVAMYVLWKSLEALLMDSERSGRLSSSSKESIVVLIYGLATSQLFYTALMNPRYMKKSYMAFLDRMSRHRLHMVNRSVLDVFGTQASAGYEDYFPDLHPRFMSEAFMGSIWIWMIEQKVPFSRLTAGIMSEIQMQQ